MRKNWTDDDLEFVELDEDTEEAYQEEPEYTEEAYPEEPEYTEEAYSEEPEYTEEAYPEEPEYTEEAYSEEPEYTEEMAAGTGIGFATEFEAVEADDIQDEAGYEEELIYEDEEQFNSDYAAEAPAAGAINRSSIRPGKGNSESTIMDKIIVLTGIVVLAIALVTGGAYLKSKTQKQQVNSFAEVGVQLNGINLIGEQGLNAISQEEAAKFEAANADNGGEEYDENDYNRHVTVSFNLTSIQKDLKIKFINSKSNKLVAHVPFTVTVKDPDGNTSVWSDDDMDGIIYKKDIVPGTYEVTMEKLTDSTYADYTLLTGKQSVIVKKDITYQKVDVANEVKNESEVDTKKEDTVKHETEVESVLKDTVPWVESQKLPPSYTEIPKSTITDPLTTARVEKYIMAMDLTVNPINKTLSIKKDESRDLKSVVSVNVSDITGMEEGETIKKIISLEGLTWSTTATDVVELSADGTVKGKKAGTATVNFNGTVKVEVDVQESTPTPTPEPTPTPTPTPTPEPGSEPASEPGGMESSRANTGYRIETTASTEKTVPVSGTIVITVTEPDNKGKVTVDKSALAVVVGGTATAQATVSEFTIGKELVYKVASDKSDVATATVDTAGKITISGKAAGKANITVTVNYKNGADTTAATATIEVTVGANKSIALDKSSVSLYAETSSSLTAVVKGAISGTPEITAASSDEAVLKVTVGALSAANGQVSAPINMQLLKEGTAVITVSCKENGEEVKATCTVTVKAHPKYDKTTALKDQSGRVLYVQDGSNYREAVVADYYTYDKFFVKGEERYAGWQTLNGKVYYFKGDGTKVTGEQVIQGAKYTFASDGSLIVGTGTVGIDVSRWNGNINWNQVKNSGISYVIIRCGYRGSTKGSLIVDPMFEDYIKGATAAGLKVGVYFVTQAVDEREAVEEASMVLEMIKDYTISYPVFLDVEPSGGRGDKISKETRTAVCKAFCETIKNANYTPGIYANKNWFTEKMDASALGAYKIWLAQYAEKPTYTGRYDMWQYRSNGRVSGISGDVDMNHSYLGY